MRNVSNEEIKALLKGAQDGILDLRTMPGYSGATPPVYYGECTKHDDGSITWEAKYLPIVSKWAWDVYHERKHREPLVKLSREDRAEIVKASIFGQINEDKLPSIYPLTTKPRLTDILYTNFEDVEDDGDLPGIPEEWHEQFVGFLEPCPGFAPHLFTISHRMEEMQKRYDFQKDADAIDFRTGKPLEDATMANFYDNLLQGFCMGI